MKNLKQATVLMFLVGGCAMSVQSQEQPTRQKQNANAPSVFREVKAKVPFAANEISHTLQLREGTKSKVFIAPDFMLEGEIVSNFRKNKQVSGIQLKAANYGGALLTLSRITEEDGSTSFTGRIYNRETGEAYVLTKENDQYFFVKTNAKFLLVD